MLTFALGMLCGVWLLALVNMRRDQRRQPESMGAEYDRIEREVLAQWEQMKAESQAHSDRVAADRVRDAWRTGHRVRCGEPLLPGVYCGRTLGHGGSHDATVTRRGMA